MAQGGVAPEAKHLSHSKPSELEDKMFKLLGASLGLGAAICSGFIAYKIGAHTSELLASHGAYNQIAKDILGAGIFSTIMSASLCGTIGMLKEKYSESY